MEGLVDIQRSDVYKKIESIILNNCDLEDLGLNGIQEHHSLNAELGIDSVDFLNVIFDIEESLKIKFPSEQWMNEASQIKPGDPSDYFLMTNFVDFIHELVLNEN